MGRKKKPFIDKKNAVKFNLVHRSQNDPLIDQLDLGQMVLAEDSSTRDERLQEQKKYGIYFEDDYSYLQHLKERNPSTDDNSTSILLPAEVFGNEVKTDKGELERIVPLKGPQLEWDPDIVRVLDEEDCSEGELEDDFVAMASKENNGMTCNDGSLEPWWVHRGDYGIQSHDLRSHDVESSDECDSSLSNKKSTRFTEYSLSSAVVPRNEGLSLLDERFDEFMVEYEDDQIGPLHENERQDGGRNVDDVLIDGAISQFVIDQQSKATKLVNVGKDTVGVIDEEMVDNEKGGNSSEEEIVQLEKKQHEWDCESVLSTYSNLYNHPTLIKEQTSNQQRKKCRKSNSLSTDESLSSTVPQASTFRPKCETLEEKRARKEAIKEERRIRRSNKKINREMFKREQLRIEKQLINNPKTTPLL